MRRTTTEALAVGRVIGDVVDAFVPAADMTVKYGERNLHINGSEIPASELLRPPRVSVILAADSAAGADAIPLFTLILTDPDAPSPSEPSSREHVHWIVKDIPGGGETCQGMEILNYEPPKPLIGIHRYVFVLFKQQGPYLVSPPLNRDNFRTREFADTCNLGLPVAAFYFNAQKKVGGRRR